MTKVTALPDRVDFDVAADETLLEAALRSGVPFAQAASGLRNLELHRVWAIFDWDQAGWQSFVSDPEVPAIFQEAGFTQRPPESAESLREHEA